MVTCVDREVEGCGEVMEGGERGGEEEREEWKWDLEAEMEKAAAAGARAAEECGSTGEELMSRMALEAVGLLVEGLAGQQVGLLLLGPFVVRRVSCVTR